jgi:hypothetical protein
MSRCAACGRRLRRSSPSGLGPVCAKRLGVPVDRPARRIPVPRSAARPAGPEPVHCPGQTEIPLTPFQPTLESL